MVENGEDKPLTIFDLIAEIGNKPGPGSPPRKTQCPNCGTVYYPDLPRGEGTPTQREQHLSGICSDKCWNEYLGIDPSNNSEVEEK